MFEVLLYKQQRREDYEIFYGVDTQTLSEVRPQGRTLCVSSSVFGVFRYVFNNADFDFGNSSSNHNADCPAYSIFIWPDVIFIQN